MRYCKIGKRSICSESGTVWKLAQFVRSEENEKEEEFAGTIETDFIRDVLVTTEQLDDERPMFNILKKIKEKMNVKNEKDSEEKEETHCYKIVDDDLENEYENNHELLSCCFPWLFPFKLKEEVFGTATVPLECSNAWLQYHDDRFAKEKNFIFLLYDQLKRHATNKSVSLKIKQAGE